MAAGSISNMFDRLVRGHVVDYVGFRLEDKHLEGITYNFADFFIAAGAVITVMTKLFRPGSKKKKKAKNEKCLKSEKRKIRKENETKKTEQKKVQLKSDWFLEIRNQSLFSHRRYCR